MYYLSTVYMSCPFKDIFGKPREGAHAYRVFDLAAVDVVFTILGGLALAHAFGWSPIVGVVALFALGIVAHRAFCVKTKVDTLLFGDEEPGQK